MAAPAPLDLGNLFSARGLVALITGGGTGIGFMMARALAEAGAHRVYIVGRRVEVLQAAAASIGKPSVVPLYCDVTSRVSLESVLSVIESDVGFLNLLVCNSGIGGPQVKQPTAETTIDEWRAAQLAVDVDQFTDTFKVNCTSVWYTTMTFLKLLDNGNKRGNVEQSSQVIVTSSIAGFNKKAPGGYPYGSSKAAATHIAKQLSIALPTWGIRANCIAPGLFPSEMSAPIVQAAGGSSESGNLEYIPLDNSIVPMGRMGNSSDLSGAILYMASKAGGYLNGNVIVLDGGRLGTFSAVY